MAKTMNCPSDKHSKAKTLYDVYVYQASCKGDNKNYISFSEITFGEIADLVRLCEGQGYIGDIVIKEHK